MGSSGTTGECPPGMRIMGEIDIRDYLVWRLAMPASRTFLPWRPPFDPRCGRRHGIPVLPDRAGQPPDSGMNG